MFMSPLVFGLSPK